MKHGTPNHPKTLNLMQLLALQTFNAVGVLETLWLWCRSYAIRGDVGRWSNEVIARGIGWDRDPNELIDALVRSGWLDKVDDPAIRLAIHDIQEHADNSWKQALYRAGLTWWDGSEPRLKRDEKMTAKKPDVKRTLKKRLTPVERTSNQTETETETETASVSFLPSVEKETEKTPLPPPEKKSRKQKPDAVVAATLSLPPRLNTDRFRAALSDWFGFRKEIHKPLTDTTIKKQLAFLESLGEEKACQTIDFSITQGYMGLIEPKPNGNGKPGGKPKECFRDRGIMRGTPEQEAEEARLISQVLGGPPEEDFL